MRTRCPRNGGFTTIELMVAFAILGVVILQTLAVFTTQQRTYHSQERAVSAQEDARLAADMMLLDVRMAGFMVASFAGISSRDGGNSDADVLCVSDSSVLGEDQISLATGRFERAVISSAVGAGSSNVAISSGSGDIDGDTDSDFVVDRGVIISDGSASHCAHVTSVSSTNIGFTPATPSGFSVAATSGRAVPATIYQLTGAGLERNRELLTSQVEDLQIEFGIDTDDDGVIESGEFPVHDISGANTNRIRAVRLSVMTRTTIEDVALSGNGRHGVANRDPSGTPDSFRRRIAVMRASPRNLL